MPKPKHKPLELDETLKARFTPLPSLDVADYIDDYSTRLRATGVFDHLTIMGAGVDLDSLENPDLAAIGILGTAFTKMLSPDGGAGKQGTRDIVMDHCTRFAVQVFVEGEEGEPGDWVSIDSEEAFNEHLLAEHMIDLVKTLGSEALRPLWNRLASKGGAAPKK